MSKKILVASILISSLAIGGLFVLLLLPPKYTSLNFFQPTPPQDIEQQNITSEPKIETKPPVLVYALRHTLPDGSYEIITSSTGDYYPSAVIWKDWLFFVQSQSFKVQNKTEFNTQVVAYNFKTNEKKIVFDAQKNGYGLSGGETMFTEGLLLNTVWVIDNDLYFQFGGAKVIHIVWTKLPSPDDFKELTSGDTKNIFTINNTYWLESGFGDACVSHMQLRFFDPTSKAIGPEMSFSDNCGQGKQFIGQRGQDLIVQEFHSLTTTDYSEKSATDKIYLLNFKDLTIRSVLGADNLPSLTDPYGIYYNQTLDSLLLVGSDTYAYNFKTDRLKEIVSGLSNYYLSEWTKDDKACLSLLNNSADRQYAVLDLVTGKVNSSTEKCYTKGTEFEYHYSNEEYLRPKNLSTIELPVGFEFVKQE